MTNKMLEWTGERFLPWMKESTIAYEHLHRYAYAATLVKDKRVLDLACGEGYGSKMLAAAASSVIGVDIAENAIAHAAVKYGGATLQYISGSITAVPVAGTHSFDAIVCFEAIEHVEDHEKLLGEVKRLLKPDGIFVVSTPNKAVYHEESTEENPFHLKELSFEEFQQLLARHFKDIRYLGQRIHPSSSIWPIGSQSGDGFREFVLERHDNDFQFIANDKRVPLYFIAIASDSRAVLPQMGSVLVDHSNGLIREKDAELRASANAIKWRDNEIKEREKAISSLEDAVKWREEQIQELAEGLEWTRNRVSEMEKTIGSHEEGLAWRAHQVEDLQNENTTLATHLQNTEEQLHNTRKQLQNTQAQLGIAAQQLETIYASSGWKLILRVRRLRDRLAPAGSSRRRLFERLMGLARSRAQ